MTDPIADAMRLAEALGDVLAGKPPEVQGAALADALATWLAGHIVPGDGATTARIRDRLLAQHIAAVQRLAPLYERKR